MSATTILGKVRCTPRGAWNIETPYEYLDIVTNAGSSYIALQAVPASTVLNDATYWMIIASKGDKGDVGEVSQQELDDAVATLTLTQAQVNSLTGLLN